MLEVGQQVGNYRVSRLIGQGGMGFVYQAQHQYIGRQAAIKILRPELKNDSHAVTRFLNEARAVNLVKHPGLLEIFEYGFLPDGAPHIVMELLSGETLAARLRQAGGRLSQAARIGRGIALALAAAHQAGVVHRDLKPHNVFLIADPEQAGAERVKVIDFGIAKLDPVVLPQATEEPLPRTRSGAVLGTPEYMAPEQCLGAAQADAKADVYALGVMLYEMLTGRRPFVAELPSEVMTLQVRGTPPPLRTLAPTLPEELVALVHRMLSKRSADRPTMSQVAERLLPWVETPLALAPRADTDAAADGSQTQSSLHAELGGRSSRSSVPERAVGPGAPTRTGAARLLALFVIASLSISAAVLYQRRPLAPAPMPPAVAPRDLRVAERTQATVGAISAPPDLGTGSEAAAQAPPPPSPSSIASPATPAAPSRTRGAVAGSARSRGHELVVPLFKAKRPHG